MGGQRKKAPLCKPGKGSYQKSNQMTLTFDFPACRREKLISVVFLS
jgi:hypothetical protein